MALTSELISNMPVAATELFEDDNVIIDQSGVHKKCEVSLLSIYQALFGSSFAIQAPTGLGVALQIEFGAAQVNADINLDALGNITFVKAGTYQLIITLTLDRTSSAGEAIILLRGLANGSQIGNPVGAKITDTEDTQPVQLNFSGYIPAGTIITYQIARDPAGIDNGQLVSLPGTGALASWGATPSAAIRVNKLSPGPIGSVFRGS